MKKLKNIFAFDLGTSKFRLYQKGEKVIEIIPIIDIDNEKHDKLVEKGKIADFYGTEIFLKQIIRKIHKPIFGFFSPSFDTLVSVPSDNSDVTLRAFRDSMEKSGAKTCYMFFDCFFVAVGLGIDIENSTALIVDFGAGKTSITTIKGYQIIKNDILDIAGLVLDETIQTYLSYKYDLTINLKLAEKLKIEYVDFRKKEKVDKKIRIIGKEKYTDKFKEIEIQKNEITECLQNDIDILVMKIVSHYENLDNVDLLNIKKNGIYLIGGGFKLKGFIELISEKLNVNSLSQKLNSDFMSIGIGRVLKNVENYSKYLMH